MARRWAFLLFGLASAFAGVSVQCSDPYATSDPEPSGDASTPSDTGAPADGGSDTDAGDASPCDGKCQPVQLAAPKSAGYMRVDATYVHAVGGASGNIIPVPKGGGPLETVIFDEAGAPFGLAVDDTHVFFTRNQPPLGVWRRAKDGVGGSELLVATDTVEVATGASSFAYARFGGTDAGAALLVAPASAPDSVTELATGKGGIESIAITATDVFFGQNGGVFGAGVWRASRILTTAPTQLSPLAARRIAIDANNVYFVSAGQPTLFSVPRGGGATKTLGTARGNVDVGDVTTDGKHVYWVAAIAGQILRTTIDGSETIEIASAVSPRGIAVDDVAVYWNDVGHLMKLAK